MIPLKRIRTAPPIHENFQTVKREEFNLELMLDRREFLKSPNNKQKFSSGRWKRAKPQLLAESNDKCAYCEAPTSVVAFGDVEHYRPKSSYWWLAYCYDNYLPACQLCNQKFKKAKFPTKGNSLKSPVTVKRNSTDTLLKSRQSLLSPDALNALQVSAFHSEHDAERPFIINPYIDDPSQWLAWEANDTLRRVKLIAKSGIDDAEKFVEASEHDLGLNRKELQELRYTEFEKFKTFKLALKDRGISSGTKAAIKTVVTNMLDDSAPFAGMLRFFDLKF